MSPESPAAEQVPADVVVAAYRATTAERTARTAMTVVCIGADDET